MAALRANRPASFAVTRRRTYQPCTVSSSGCLHIVMKSQPRQRAFDEVRSAPSRRSTYDAGYRHSIWERRDLTALLDYMLLSNALRVVTASVDNRHETHFVMILIFCYFAEAQPQYFFSIFDWEVAVNWSLNYHTETQNYFSSLFSYLHEKSSHTLTDCGLLDYSDGTDLLHWVNRLRD